MCVCVCVCVWIMEKNPKYGEKLKNKVIQSKEFNVKESRWYNVSVLIHLMASFLSPDASLLKRSVIASL